MIPLPHPIFGDTHGDGEKWLFFFSQMSFKGVFLVLGDF